MWPTAGANVIETEFVVFDRYRSIRFKMLNEPFLRFVEFGSNRSSDSWVTDIWVTGHLGNRIARTLNNEACLHSQ
ncbi:hypothetical protein L596_010203 [Steinernema carpocapsae]|uniref:Uncharacterized protein n=1 Tax=Steinernema carpocapsae TaxID=34508 RepID=A0A4U5PHX3_STECR|nr:hypothetical protein L596_010203 [Steinernema carpocapsae]